MADSSRTIFIFNNDQIRYFNNSKLQLVENEKKEKIYPKQVKDKFPTINGNTYKQLTT